ncbi:MAG: transcription termination factor Rho [Lachnospiraceae bacterium]|nr:transcription termination factor Rho [Lachnospiraceae bacterium]
MSIELEKQSLSTLKEWAHALGIRGMSNARKADLVALLSQVGEARIEHAMNLTGGPKEQAVRGRPRLNRNADAAPKPAEPAPEAPKAPEEEPPRPAEPDDNISGTGETSRRPNYRRAYESPVAATRGNRGGFGSYAPSYRAQAEAVDTQERGSRFRYEMPSPDRRQDESRPAAPERSVYPDKNGDRPARIERTGERPAAAPDKGDSTADKTSTFPDALAGPSGEGILEVMPEGFGFIRCENYMPGDNDIYVSPAQIHRFGLKTGDILAGVTKVKTGTEKFPALLYISTVNGESPDTVRSRKPFEELTPEFPHERIHLETEPEARAMRIVDLMAPIGKGQRGMIVSPPKAGKTTLIKEVAKAVTRNHPDMQLIILLIDERPEEVTDIKEEVEGPNVEVIYSTFDETPEHHKRVTEMVLGRAQRQVEHGRDVIILLDSITRLSRAYNLTVAPSGRTLSGGLDPAALYMPKKFFGAARCMREGGSLTILATALVETGSRMDDVIFEEFKGTGNMELVLDRKLSERRIFPAIDILKSGTRRDDKLLSPEELETVSYIRQAISNPVKGEEALEKVLDLMRHTRTNREFCALVRKMRF